MLSGNRHLPRTAHGDFAVRRLRLHTPPARGARFSSRHLVPGLKPAATHAASSRPKLGLPVHITSNKTQLFRVQHLTLVYPRSGNVKTTPPGAGCGACRYLDISHLNFRRQAGVKTCAAPTVSTQLAARSSLSVSAFPSVQQENS